MPPPRPIVDDLYRKYATLRVQLHHLFAEDKHESAEAEAVEEQLTELWDTLTDQQRLSLNGMAADLNWVRRGGDPAPRGPKREDVPLDGWTKLVNAIGARDWHALLYYMRTCYPILSFATLVR